MKGLNKKMFKKALSGHDHSVKLSVREECSIMNKNELRNATGKLFCKHFIRDGERILQTGNCEMPAKDFILQLLSLPIICKSERFNS